MASHSCNPWIGSSNFTSKFTNILCKSGVIGINFHPRFVLVLEDKCFLKSSNLILALRMGPSSEPGSRISFLHRWECFLCISIFSSLPSTSMLHHMNIYSCLSTIISTYHRFRVSVKGCSSLMLLSSFLSRQRLTLSNALTVSDCGNLLSFPMNSGCQFDLRRSAINQSSTHWQLGWLKTVRLDFPLLQILQLLESKSEMGVWDVITQRTKLWHRNDRSSYHCSKNSTGWEFDPESEKWAQNIHWIE